MGKPLDLTGKRFGKLTAIKYTGETIPIKGRVWLCRCDCGNYRKAFAKQLNNKEVTMCENCIKNRHRETSYDIKYRNKVRLHLRNILGQMKRRCYNPNCESYKYYGGRGITICKEWLENSQNFYEWALSAGYNIGLSIERKDVNGNYCPENCCFIPISEQSLNRNNTLIISYENKRIPVGEMVRELGIDYYSFVSYLKKYPKVRSTTNLL